MIITDVRDHRRFEVVRAHSWERLLRRRGEEAAAVTSIELFFDLVYALAITQLTHYRLHELTPAGAGLQLLLAVR